MASSASTAPGSKSSFSAWFDNKQQKDDNTETKDASKMITSTLSSAATKATILFSGGVSAVAGLAGKVRSTTDAAPEADLEAGNKENSSTNTDSSNSTYNMIKNMIPGLNSNSNTNNRSEWNCGLSVGQRMQLAFVFILGSFVLFSLALFVFLPTVALFPSKFATAITFGSILFMAGMAMIRGPRTFLSNLFDRNKLTFVSAYIGSMILTLYATLSVQWYSLTIFATLIQLGALGYYAASFIPGGITGMTFLTRTVGSSIMSGGRGIAGLVVRR